MQKLGVWGSVASIIGFALYFVPTASIPESAHAIRDGGDAMLLSQNSDQKSSGPKSPNISVREGNVTINYSDKEARHELTQDSNNVAQEQQACKKNALIKETADFRATVEGFSQKGKTVNISVSVANKTSEDIKVSLFQIYAMLTSPAGETQTKRGNRFSVVIEGGNTESFSYNFSFKEDFIGDAFDFTLVFEKPRFNFAFYGITNACFR